MSSWDSCSTKFSQRIWPCVLSIPGDENKQKEKEVNIKKKSVVLWMVPKMHVTPYSL